MARLSKITTKTGDQGTSSLSDGVRISKADRVFEVMGDVDELNAHLGHLAGLIVSSTDADSPADLVTRLHQVQQQLFNIGGQLSMPDYEGITVVQLQQLDDWIQQDNAQLPPLKEFILPRGSQMVTQCHIARTVCRRVERHFFAWSEQAKLPLIGQYLNRLSDWLFITARQLQQQPEQHWQKMNIDS